MILLFKCFQNMSQSDYRRITDCRRTDGQKGSIVRKIEMTMTARRGSASGVKIITVILEIV